MGGTVFLRNDSFLTCFTYCIHIYTKVSHESYPWTRSLQIQPIVLYCWCLYLLLNGQPVCFFFFLLCCVFVYCLKNMNSNKWQQQTEHLVRLFLCVPCESQIQTSDMALLLLLLLYILRLYIATLLLILILSLLLLFTLCNGLERLLYVNESF